MKKNGKMAVITTLVLVGLVLVSLAIAKPSPRAAKACHDGVDNDGDGYIDYPNDPGCSSKNDRSELNTAIECDDGSDNDGDGDTDMSDSGCASPTDTDESDCGDGVCEGNEVCDGCVADCGYCDTCADTDDGNVIYTFGTASGYLNDQYFSDNDYCVDSGTIMEYYCSGDYEQSSQQSCGTDSYGSNYCSAGDEIYTDFTDYFCSAGECDSTVTPTFQEDCDDQDNYGSNYCMNGSVQRDFYNYYCSGGSCLYTVSPELVETCAGTEECVDGECVIADSCSDTDYGFDLDNQGTISGYAFQVPYSHTDFCTGVQLTEFYCYGASWSSYNLSCLGNYTGCASGACY